ncbi:MULTISPECIES: hypothetical protein [unclassified Tardiphaga]|uniref:hypothetical protein n=1 Tax=unclassified Tardiphaga TaxID=2631404 RepID=UPI003F8F662E
MKMAVALFTSLVITGSVCAQTLPDTENGRYALSPMADGVVRLDTRTGTVSTCTGKGSGWACTIVPDERAAYDAEIGRLLTDNAALKAELAQRDPSVTGKIDEALPKQDSLQPKSDGERKLEIPLPSDKDIDRAMSFLESAWRKLIDIATRLHRDSGGKI